MFYDVVIIGGGIAGIYTMYKLCRQSPEIRVLLLEKENYLGGRVYTYEDDSMLVEGGAGRFSKNHRFLNELIAELKLSNKIMPSSGGAVFFPANHSGIPQNSIFDAPGNDYKNIEDRQNYLQPLANMLLDMQLGETLPNAGLITKVILASEFESREKLMRMSFSQYALEILGDKSLIDYIHSTFGYYSELVIMNAYDAIQLMIELGPQNQFFVLKGGLSQIIDKMVAVIERNKNYKILKKRKVEKIEHLVGEMGGSGFRIYLQNSSVQYGAKKCVCALPRPALDKLDIFKPLEREFSLLKCGALCRIYSKFDGKDKEWFRDLPKFTTNNELRMVIPYDYKKGLIMISYSDNVFAKFWHNLHKEKGIRAVNKLLKEKIAESIGREIPMPSHTNIFYWPCGVGYWGVGANSEVISKKMVKPFEQMNLFICGEHFSEKYQQWMEGALETSENVLCKLFA